MTENQKTEQEKPAGEEAQKDSFYQRILDNKYKAAATALAGTALISGGLYASKILSTDSPKPLPDHSPASQKPSVQNPFADIDICSREAAKVNYGLMAFLPSGQQRDLGNISTGTTDVLLSADFKGLELARKQLPKKSGPRTLYLHGNLAGLGNTISVTTATPDHPDGQLYSYHSRTQSQSGEFYDINDHFRLLPGEFDNIVVLNEEGKPVLSKPIPADGQLPLEEIKNLQERDPDGSAQWLLNLYPENFLREANDKVDKVIKTVVTANIEERRKQVGLPAATGAGAQRQ